jgi:prevent-host-death family protein
MAMKTVGIAELTSDLSRYLAAVRNGEEIIVTPRRRPIARIVSVEKRFQDELRIIRAKKPVSALKKIKGMNIEVDLLAELLADRRRR